MNPNTKGILACAIRDKHFTKAVDLGCGEGYYGDVLKQHADYLIGVDHNYPRLQVAKEFAGYDEVVLMEAQHYKVPSDTDAVFMFDFIEHISKGDGVLLLIRLRNIPFIFLTTPVAFHSWAWRNGHQSLWTEKELRENGFEIKVYNLGLLGMFVSEIAALRNSNELL